jgi:hypothetical protein
MEMEEVPELGPDVTYVLNLPDNGYLIMRNESRHNIKIKGVDIILNEIWNPKEEFEDGAWYPIRYDCHNYVSKYTSRGDKFDIGGMDLLARDCDWIGDKVEFDDANNL